MICFMKEFVSRFGLRRAFFVEQSEKLNYLEFWSAVSRARAMKTDIVLRGVFIFGMIFCMQGLALRADELAEFPTEETIEDGWESLDWGDTEDLSKEKSEPSSHEKSAYAGGFVGGGELTKIGASGILNKHTSLALGLGAEAIDSVYYLRFRPEFNFHFWKFGVSIGAPIRFPFYDANRSGEGITSFFDGFSGLDEFWRPRKYDWDEPEDFLRLIRYLTFGEPNESVYVDFSRINPITLGHGQLVRNFAPNINVDEDNLFANAKVDFGVFGAQAFLGPFLVPHQFGLSVLTRPLSGILGEGFLGSLEFSANYAADFEAPISLLKEKSGVDGPVLVALNSRREFVFNEGVVQGLGVTVGTRLWEAEFLLLDLYADYSHLFLPEVKDELLKLSSPAFSGGGATIGFLSRLSLGAKEWSGEGKPTKAWHTLQGRLEGRFYGSQYWPSYFDTLYNAQKFLVDFGVEEENSAKLPTKMEYLAQSKGEPSRLGYLLQFGYSLAEWFSLAIMYEDAVDTDSLDFVPAGRSFTFHVESSDVGWIQFLATYQFRNFEKIEDIFDFKHPNELIFFAGRIKVLPFLYLNGWVQRTFRAGFGRGDDLTLRRLAGAGADSPEYRFSSVGLKSALSFGFDVEIGIQF